MVDFRDCFFIMIVCLLPIDLLMKKSFVLQQCERREEWWLLESRISKRVSTVIESKL